MCKGKISMKNMNQDIKKHLIKAPKPGEKREERIIAKGETLFIEIPDDIYIALKDVRDLVHQYQDVLDALNVKSNHLIDIAVDQHKLKAPKGYRHIVAVDMIDKRLTVEIKKI